MGNRRPASPGVQTLRQKVKLTLVERGRKEDPRLLITEES